MDNKVEVTKEELKAMPIRNPERDNDGSFLCEVNHPEFGWIPFRAMADDVEEHGRKLFERIPQEFKVIPQVVEPEIVKGPPSLEELIQTISTRLDKLEKRIK